MTIPEPHDQPGTPIAEQLFSAIGLLRRRTRRTAGRPWPQTPLTGSQAEMVRLLRLNPGTSVAEAAAALGLAANTVSTLVRQLTDAGLVERVSDAADRRIARLTLTETARSQVEQWRDRRSLLVARAWEGLAEADRQAIEQALPAIIRLAEALHPESAPESPSEEIEK